MPAQNQRHALQRWTGGGSLAGTLVTADPQIARQFIADAHYAWANSILNEESAKNPPGMAPHTLVHGGLVAQEAVKN